MRKGYTLIELIVIMGILVMISLPLARLFRTLVNNVPRNVRVVNTQSDIQLALMKIARDMDRGISLPLSLDDIKSGDNSLLIELPEGTVFYHFDNDKITRRIIKSLDSSTDGHEPSEDAIQTEIGYTIIKPKIIPFDPNSLVDPNAAVEYSVPLVTPDPNSTDTKNDPNDPNDTADTLPTAEPFELPATGRDRTFHKIDFPPPVASQVMPEPNIPVHADPNTLRQDEPNIPIIAPPADPIKKPVPEPNQPVAIVSPVQPIEDPFPGQVTSTWTIPDGRISATLLTENEIPYAVAIKTGIEYKYQGISHLKWKTTRVFYLNTPGTLLKTNETTHETIQ